mmetsp:Transcript_67642/g.197981  ORF Transcript_67642/g.197981 Transcript_67642/m.197981 type:complete len:218 (-) Transcript_67642:269-922(-)
MWLRLLDPCHLQHSFVLVIQRVLPEGLLRLRIEPIHHPILAVLKDVGRLGLFHERPRNPSVILVGKGINAQVLHVLLHGGSILLSAVQDPVNSCFHVGALLQGDLDLVPGDPEGAPRALVEQPHVPVFLALNDGQELVPDICNVGVPIKHCEVLWHWALGQVDDLELGPKGALTCHEDNLVLIPLDNDFVANRDVVLPLRPVLRRICPLVFEAELHD